MAEAGLAAPPSGSGKSASGGKAAEAAAAVAAELAEKQMLTSKVRVISSAAVGES